MTGPVPTLSQRELNRATLARQRLLERADLGVVEAIEAIGGLQAQEPASPYLALWARLPSFAVADLDAAFLERRVVKASLMRGTLHAVSAEDYRCLWPAAVPRDRAVRRQDRGAPPDDARITALLEATAAFTREPRTIGEIGEHLNGLGILRGTSVDEIGWWVWRLTPVLRVPTEGKAWSFDRRPRFVDAASWLGREGVAFPSIEVSRQHLVRRYLGAFGPARAADIGAWAGVPIGSIRPALAVLDDGGELWHGRDERGRALVDLVDAPRPSGDTPAPPRLLPMWDSTLLAHADRTRIIDDADRAIVIARNGDTLPAFLVDGRIAGLWWADPGPGGRTTVVIEPFRPLAAADGRGLEAEAARLATLVEPLEPRVYGRYQRWRPAR